MMITSGIATASASELLEVDVSGDISTGEINNTTIYLTCCMTFSFLKKYDEAETGLHYPFKHHTHAHSHDGRGD